MQEVNIVVSHFEIENRLITILFCSLFIIIIIIIIVIIIYRNKNLFKNLNSLKLC